MGRVGGVEGRVGYGLKRAQHALRLRMDEGLRGLGLTTPQYAALSALESEPGMSGADLARRAFVTPQTMNGIVVGLEGRGWISRRPHPSHGRVLMSFLTPEGEALVTQAHAVVGEVEKRMLAHLDERERSKLAETLRGCAEALADPTGP